jgi:hypothetical protein
MSLIVFLSSLTLAPNGALIPLQVLPHAEERFEFPILKLKPGLTEIFVTLLRVLSPANFIVDSSIYKLSFTRKPSLKKIVRVVDTGFELEKIDVSDAAAAFSSDARGFMTAEAPLSVKISAFHGEITTASVSCSFIQQGGADL